MNRCCICGKEFEGYGNKPYGLLRLDFKPVQWKKNKVCCDECFNEFVVPGRVILRLKDKKII